METRRFDELTVALTRGGSRRGVLRGLVGGVLGAVAINQSGALAKNDKDKPEKGGGKPITSPSKPLCPRNKTTDNCPACYQARFGPEGNDDPSGCCVYGGKEQECSQCTEENAEYCSAINDGHGTCVTMTCRKDNNRCDYKVKNDFCNNIYGDGSACCPVFTSPKFGHCITAPETCQQV